MFGLGIPPKYGEVADYLGSNFDELLLVNTKMGRVASQRIPCHQHLTQVSTSSALVRLVAASILLLLDLEPLLHSKPVIPRHIYRKRRRDVNLVSSLETPASNPSFNQPRKFAALCDIST
jgi:hypothetical protein